MEKHTILSISDLFVSVFDKPVVQGVNAHFTAGTVYAIMGPNGSGKSSLAYALMGHPDYMITQGVVTLDGVDIAHMPVHERARGGLFLAFQHPCEVPGVSVLSFLKEAYSAIKNVHVSVADFKTLLLHRCEQVGIDVAFIERGLNEGFSGGEKKRLEMLQLLLLQPSIAILDEIDSGLDVDALKIVADGIALARQENDEHCSYYALSANFAFCCS